MTTRYFAAQLKRDRRLENADKDNFGHPCDVLLFSGDIVAVSGNYTVVDGEFMHDCATLRNGYEFLIDASSVEIIGRIS